MIQKIAVSGTSGFIGSSLVSFLTLKGYHVCRLVRDNCTVRRSPSPSSHEILWDPQKGVIDSASLEGIDAIINLAGENITGKRWTRERKEIIKKSRVDGTLLLSKTIAALKTQPKVFISASAVGYYGNRGEEVLNEDSSPGAGFLCEVCQEWEKAAQPAKENKIRVVNLRLGMVLNKNGGVLAKMLPVFLFGFGGKVGNGHQYMSWISLSDLMQVILFIISNETICGPVNAVSPNSVINEEFTKILGKVLRRPSFFKIPALAIKLVFGQMGEELFLGSTHAIPKKLIDNGFNFLHADLEQALRHELGE